MSFVAKAKTKSREQSVIIIIFTDVHERNTRSVQF